MEKELNIYQQATLEEAEKQHQETSNMIDDLNARILKAIEEARKEGVANV